jgi:hypothetical protein
MIRGVGPGTTGFAWSKDKTRFSFELHDGRKLSYRFVDFYDIRGFKVILRSISRQFSPPDSMNNLGRFYFSYVEEFIGRETDPKAVAIFSEIRGLTAKSREAREALKVLIENGLRQDASLSSHAALLAKQTLTPEHRAELFSEDVQKTIEKVMSTWYPWANYLFE